MEPGMTSGRPVVVGVDSVDNAGEVIRWANGAASCRHAPVLLVHALDLSGGLPASLPTGEDARGTVMQGATTLLREARQVAETTATTPVRTQLSEDAAAS
jgi:hypothetical protein